MRPWQPARQCVHAAGCRAYRWRQSFSARPHPACLQGSRLTSCKPAQLHQTQALPPPLPASLPSSGCKRSHQCPCCCCCRNSLIRRLTCSGQSCCIQWLLRGSTSSRRRGTSASVPRSSCKSVCGSGWVQVRDEGRALRSGAGFRSVSEEVGEHSNWIAEAAGGHGLAQQHCSPRAAAGQQEARPVLRRHLQPPALTALASSSHHGRQVGVVSAPQHQGGDVQLLSQHPACKCKGGRKVVGGRVATGCLAYACMSDWVRGHPLPQKRPLHGLPSSKRGMADPQGTAANSPVQLVRRPPRVVHRAVVVEGSGGCAGAPKRLLVQLQVLYGGKGAWCCLGRAAGRQKRRPADQAGLAAELPAQTLPSPAFHQSKHTEAQRTNTHLLAEGAGAAAPGGCVCEHTLQQRVVGGAQGGLPQPGQLEGQHVAGGGAAPQAVHI